MMFVYLFVLLINLGASRTGKLAELNKGLQKLGAFFLTNISVKLTLGLFFALSITVGSLGDK